MGKLVRFLAGGTACEISLDRERLTIGRRPDNDVCIKDLAVSGEHAAIVTILADSFLEDLGSTNGTLVNGKRIGKHFLRDRDEIDVGRQILVYLADDSATLEARTERSNLNEEPAGAQDEATATSPARSPDAMSRGTPRADASVVALDNFSEDAARASADSAHGIEERSRIDASSSSSPRAGPPCPEPLLKVLDGPRAGRIVTLSKSETLVGRAGVQVAALRRVEHEVMIIPLEGAAPPGVNGMPIPPSGVHLSSGDILEIAGARLELLIPNSSEL